ncbi:hypothetical protein BSFA1_87410 (plasmid) [Burkholderia sp. SFA1]|nr:hypothetical protein BSFA1_87410 [Burkholderia sp. SFA1]
MVATQSPNRPGSRSHYREVSNQAPTATVLVTYYHVVATRTAQAPVRVPHYYHVVATQDSMGDGSRAYHVVGTGPPRRMIAPQSLVSTLPPLPHEQQGFETVPTLEVTTAR